MEKKKYHEINHYKDILFPVEIYRVNEKGVFPFGRGLRDFHWHDELQFTLAVRGSLTLQVDGEQYFLNNLVELSFLKPAVAFKEKPIIPNNA